MKVWYVNKLKKLINIILLILIRNWIIRQKSNQHSWIC